MTYMGPYNPRYNYTFLWEKPEIIHRPVVNNKDTLLEAIDNDPKMSKVAALVRKAGLEKLFDDRQANLSIFLPNDETIPPAVEKYDKYRARIFIYSNLISVRIPSNRLYKNVLNVYETRDKANEMVIEYKQGKAYVNGHVVIGYTEKQNGILYVLDGAQIPTFV